MTQIQRGDPVEETILVNLLQRAQDACDPAAFDGLYLLFADRVFRYLLARIGDPDLAEDITAQVFLRLIEKVGIFRIGPRDNVAIFSAWLYRLAHNKMVDVLRSHKRTKESPLEHAAHVVSGHTMEVVEDQLDFQRVLDTLRILNDQQREVIVLRFVEELSIAETAQIMQKSEGAVKALQHRALESLRRHLQDVGAHGT
ncbi:MAG: sigma-70 family RNA polymerase sigma factor [Caldilineaceae bacterium]|nr:sigma-70 family RNA polymerase sigma factor [Caldilineaceae bacterium]